MIILSISYMMVLKMKPLGGMGFKASTHKFWGNTTHFKAK